MAKTIKTKGMEELLSLRRRINRQLWLGRISRKDWAELDRHGKAMEAKIIEMRELNEYGEEEGESIW